MLFGSTCLAFLAVAAPALAQLTTFRTTIPGSLHQCEATNLFTFQTGASRPLSFLFLPADKVPAALKTGTTTFTEASKYSPLLSLKNDKVPDNQQYNFTLAIAAGQSFEVFGFLPDGTGKNMNLPRTVQTPLPNASKCIKAVATTAASATATAKSSGGASGASTAQKGTSTASTAKSSGSTLPNNGSNGTSGTSGNKLGVASGNTAAEDASANSSTSSAIVNKTPIALLSLTLGLVGVVFVGLF